MEKLPEYGEWLLANPLFGASPPFANLTIDFRNNTGTARYWKTTVQLNKITKISPVKFGAAYEINGQKGLFEAEYRDDQKLDVKFIGTVKTECVAEPMRLIGGERPVSQWSTHEKVSAAINRSLPLLPDHVASELRAMISPEALAIMGVVLAAWALSHFFGVGELVDLLLLITGGVMMGKAALDVANHIAEFVRLLNGATSETDLDAAAREFAGAISKGGVQVVMTILMWKGGQAAKGAGLRTRVKPPLKAGELPTGELTAVPPSKIPVAARAAAELIAVGEQPKLPGLSQELAQVVRAELNRIRRVDQDCWGGSTRLQECAGGLGDAAESNAVSPIVGYDHTMWKIGNEVVDTRPKGWIKYFGEVQGTRERANQIIPALAERLERGAVLTMDEFKKYMGIRAAPRSVMFSTKPIQTKG